MQLTYHLIFHQKTKCSLYNRINLDKLYELNNLVRNISNHKVAPKDIHDEIIKIIEKPMSHSLILIGYVLSAATFFLMIPQYDKFLHHI